MSLFKRKTACCNSKTSKEKHSKLDSLTSKDLGVKVLGSGCKKCLELKTATKTALDQMGMDSNIEHITDFAQIASFGVMTTPALVIDGKLVASGKVLSVDEITKIIKEARG